MKRRDFVASLATIALAAQAETARGFQANDTLRVAAIGTGGRCRDLMSRFPQIPNVEIVAVCDVWTQHLQEGAKLASSGAFQTSDFRRILDRNDVDAVLIGAPDHQHVPLTIAACEAKKDVYVEKPLTHDLSEGAAVVEAQNKNNRIVQVGTQQRSMPHLIEAKEILRSGALGAIHKIHLSWNRNTARWDRNRIDIDPSTVDWKAFLGNARQQPFDAYRFRNWRWFWDFGGGIFTDLMVHWIDTAYWMLDMEDPAEAVSMGDHFAAEGLWETPDTVQTLLRYPTSKLQAYFEGTFINHHERAMITFMGRDATLYCDRGRYELIPQAGSKVKEQSKILSTAERGSDFFKEVDGELYHLVNWIESIRSRIKPNCPAEDGVRSAAAAHLANVALRKSKLVTWNEAVKA